MEEVESLVLEIMEVAEMVEMKADSANDGEMDGMEL